MSIWLRFNGAQRSPGGEKDPRRVRLRLCVGVHGDGVRDSLFLSTKVLLTVITPVLLTKVVQFNVFVILMSCMGYPITSLACERHFNASNEV